MFWAGFLVGWLVGGICTTIFAIFVLVIFERRSLY